MKTIYQIELLRKGIVKIVLLIICFILPYKIDKCKITAQSYLPAHKKQQNYFNKNNSSRFIREKNKLEKNSSFSNKSSIRPEKGTITKKKVIKLKSPQSKASKIENMYNRAFNVELKQYGYEFFRKFRKEKFLPVGDRYKVGPGDTIAVYFWGDPVDILKLNGFYKLTIDRDGKIFLRHIGVFYIWGLEVGEIKEKIYRALLKKFRRFEIDVTLGNLREFPVYVSGFVNKPGMVLAIGINNVVDILSLAGGISKNGSMRNITIRRIERGKLKVIKVDLYNLLISGNPSWIQIREGDSIFVGPIGETVGIAGVVKRSSIYELTGMVNTIKEAIKLAGGILPSVYSPGINLYRYENNSLNIREGNLEDIEFLNTKLRDGDFIRIKNLYNLVENEIIVNGHVGYTGKYSYREGLKLSHILKTVGILPDTNMHSACITRDKENRLISFSPLDVLKGKFDFELKKNDLIIFYPQWVYKPILVTGEIDNPKIIPYYRNITLLDVLKQVNLKKPAQHLKAEIFQNETKVRDEFIKGSYMTVYLHDLLVKALKEANIEILPGSKVLVRNADPSEKGKTITILGEVKNPGVYHLKPGITLYELIKMVGGYNKNAYPRGLIFIRKSAMRLQDEQIRISLLSMKESLAKQQKAFSQVGTGAEDLAVVRIVLRQYEQMINILREKSKMSLGRVALDIPMKLSDLKDHPDNIPLIEEDYIYIPQKPRYILVLGNVYNQISLPYDSGKTVRYYISQMGGVSKNADEDDIYIIKANGKIISRQQFTTIFDLYFVLGWDRNKLRFARNFSNMVLEEGDTIVVPTELKVPVMWRSLLKDVAQIMFQSISTAVLATRL